MALDYRRLKPSDVIRILNSTPLGEVVTATKLTRHRNRFGLRIGDSQTVDIFRYAARLLRERHDPTPLTGYEARKERERQRAAELSTTGRDIGDLPDIQDPERRALCATDLRAFCERYFPEVFTLEWSDDHLRVIAKIEQAVLEGGLFAMAMPRGSGKTSLCEVAACWAIVYGHREFVAIIAADEALATEILTGIKTAIETSDALLDDFPAACFPVRCLEGINQRAVGQLYGGRQTHIKWKEREIVMPTIEGSPSSGACIRVAGLTGQIRGMKRKRADGRTVRPSLVLIDDPQTDESARSPQQCADRELILAGAVLGLAGPDKKIAGLMAVTVIRPDDLGDRILDRDRNPVWQAERTKLLYSFPKNEDLWAEYTQIYRADIGAGLGTKRATAFYAEHREAMEEGATVAWKQRHNADELSALQHAMNLRIRNERAFFAEYQNEPLPEELGDGALLKVEEIIDRISGYRRYAVPIGCSFLTMFIDVHQNAHYYVVLATADDFTGYIVDYGAEPDPNAGHYTLSELRHTLQMAAPGAGLEGALYAGLDRLCEAKLAREWRREDGAPLRIDRCLIDANWHQSTDTVYKFCRESAYRGTVMPSHGRGITAAMKPMTQHQRRPGERLGLNWIVRFSVGKRPTRHVTFDSNFWKSHVHTRLETAPGDPGTLCFWGDDRQTHRMIAEHLRAEYRTRTKGRERTLDEWAQHVEHPDNHFLDCIVGASVAASMCGATVKGTAGDRPIQFAAAQRRSTTMAELRQRARGR